MKNCVTCVLLFIGLIIASGCVSNPKRPEAALCDSQGNCIDSRGEFKDDPRLLLCTNPTGYSLIENYIDQLELRIRKLERNCR